jgi:hypothetical protein
MITNVGEHPSLEAVSDRPRVATAHAASTLPRPVACLRHLVVASLGCCQFSILSCQFPIFRGIGTLLACVRTRMLRLGDLMDQKPYRRDRGSQGHDCASQRCPRLELVGPRWSVSSWSHRQNGWRGRRCQQLVEHRSKLRHTCFRRVGPPAVRPGTSLRRPGLPALNPDGSGMPRRSGDPPPATACQTAPGWRRSSGGALHLHHPGAARPDGSCATGCHHRSQPPRVE